MTVPLKDYEYTDYRWVDGFEFLITVEAADADSYALGDILIPRQEENPFAGYLNNFAGTEYRFNLLIIRFIQWSGPGNHG